MQEQTFMLRAIKFTSQVITLIQQFSCTELKRIEVKDYFITIDDLSISMIDIEKQIIEIRYHNRDQDEVFLVKTNAVYQYNNPSFGWEILDEVQMISELFKFKDSTLFEKVNHLFFGNKKIKLIRVNGKEVLYDRYCIHI